MPKFGVDRMAEGLAPIKITGLEHYSFPDPIVLENDEDLPLPEDDNDGVVSEDEPGSIRNLAAGEPEDKGKECEGSSSESSEEESSDKEEAIGDDDSIGAEKGALINPYEDDIDEDAIVETDDQLFTEYLTDPTRESSHSVSPTFPADSEVEETATVQNLNLFRLTGRRVFWLVPANASGKPGWIVAEIAGGPPDPHAKRQGITFQLRCNKKLDSSTPHFMCHKHNLQLVSLDKDTYGKDWYLFKK